MRAFRMWRGVPLSPEAVDGWRAWSVVEVEGELRLSSLTRAEPWLPATPFVATCPRRGHEAPGRSCSCGVYAAAEPEELARLGRIAGAAIGQVSMWGRIAEHRRGYRAGTAYPSRLRLVCVGCLGEGRGVPAAAIDHDDDAPSRLVPVCAEHAEGRVLPPAGPVEDRLLATYLVEMVPDEFVARIYADKDVERQRVRIRHRRTVIALAALTIALLGTFAWGQRPVEPGPTAAGEATVDAGPRLQNGVELPLMRSRNGVVSPPRLRVLLLTPDQFDAPRCGRVTATDVVPAECTDPEAEVFVDDVGPAGAHREGTCSDTTIAITTRGDRVLCWRSLPRA